jgi:hypothetical protein
VSILICASTVQVVAVYDYFHVLYAMLDYKNKLLWSAGTALLMLCVVNPIWPGGSFSFFMIFIINFVRDCENLKKVSQKKFHFIEIDR